MTNYNLTLMLRYTDGRISGLPFSAGPGRHKLTDGRLEAEINAFEQDGVCQYEMTLAAVCECELKYLDILVHSGALAPEAKAYNAGFTTQLRGLYQQIFGYLRAYFSRAFNNTGLKPAGRGAGERGQVLFLF